MTLAPKMPKAVVDSDPAEDSQHEAANVVDADPRAGSGDAEAVPDAPESSDAPEESASLPADAPASAEASDEPTPSQFGPGEALDDEALRAAAAALLFACPDVLTVARLVQLLERPDPARVHAALEALQERFEASDLPVVLRPIAGGWRLLSDPGLGEVVGRLRKEPKAERITPAALETLAIVAYRQPVSKAEVEAIRGVQSGQMLRTLVDRRLVRVTGRADLPGSPLQYGTTRDFLDRFGLGTLKDLPRDGELAAE